MRFQNTMFGLLVFALSDLCVAVTYRVPENFPTIQAAFNGIAPNDSIIAYTMTHTEALVAPPFEFWLLGDVLPGDTGEYERPVIDPTSLPGSDSLACMKLPMGSKPHLEDLKFVNGAAMYPRRRDELGNDLRGGIVYATSDTITVTRCIFDSVAGGISYTNLSSIAHVLISHCIFRDIRSGMASSRNTLEARDCLFEGTNYGGVGGYNWDLIERCRFTGTTEWGWIGLHRDGGIVRDCVFGPATCFTADPISIYTWGSALFERNVYQGMELRGFMFPIALREGGVIEITDNLFLNNFYAPQNPGTNPIVIYDGVEGETPLGQAIIRDNRFADNFTGTEGSQVGKLIRVTSRRGSCVIEGNRFYSNGPGSGPCIQVDSLGNSIDPRQNVFHGNQYAIRNEVGQLDARFNYWGDSTGPYHEELNPDGLGDEVRGNVLFNPWYPDTSFLETPLRSKPGVASYALRAFPNPFNESVTLKFEIPGPGIFRIELFDLLGRRVKELFVGPVAYEKIVRIDGNDLASGIYYARAWQTTHNRPVATAKLVLLK